MSKRTYKVIRVEWDDSSNYRGWHSRKESRTHEASHCTSCGVQVQVAKGHIGVTHSIGDKETDDVAETIVIPRVAVKSIEVLAKFRR